MTDQANKHADYIERYAERLCAGPAVKEHAFPINHNREEPEIAQAIRKHLRAVAQDIRAGLPIEPYWPNGEGSHGP